MTRGGTFCKFTIGSPNTSAVYLRYIARERTGGEGKHSLLCLRLPEFLVWDIECRWFVREVIRWARAEEQEELRRYRGHGTPRTHYRATLSFEEDIGNVGALALVKSWLDTVLPEARACAFLHRNTAHLHAHVWIAARQINGRKINLSAQAYRGLDEQWNRLYAEALGRDVREHLAKKWQTQVYKQLRRAGQAVEKPERAEHSWKPARFTERERERLGATAYDRDQSRTGTDKSPTSRDDLSAKTSEQGLAHREPASATERDPVQRTSRDAEQAVSAVDRLHQDASRLAERQQERNRELEAEQER